MRYGKFEADDEKPLTNEEIRKLRKLAQEQKEKEDNDDFSFTQHYFHDND